MEEMAFKSLCHSVGLVQQEKNGILSKSLCQEDKFGHVQEPERRQKSFSTIQINKRDGWHYTYYILTSCSVTNFQRQASFLSALKVKNAERSNKITDYQKLFHVLYTGQNNTNGKQNKIANDFTTSLQCY